MSTKQELEQEVKQLKEIIRDQKNKLAEKAVKTSGEMTHEAVSFEKVDGTYFGIKLKFNPDSGICEVVERKPIVKSISKPLILAKLREFLTREMLGKLLKKGTL